jgi:hypothetical protein
MSTAKRIVLAIGIAVFGMLAISALHRAEAQLNEDDFVSLATQGFMTAVDGDHPEGSRRNSYIWSMRWWNDTLYVGTLRDAVCLFTTSADQRPPGYETVCPPPGVFLTPEQRAEIWAYTPEGREGTDGTWQRVFQSPVAAPPPAIPDAQFPREFGYRGLTTCDAGGQENLYVITLGPVGGRVLYSPDGTTFPEASLLGLDLANDLGYRALLCWKERLWISPSGRLFITSFTPFTFRLDPDIAFNAVLLTNSDPSNPTSPWEAIVDVANDPQLGDANNQGLWGLEVFKGALYLGTINRTTGFEVWRADGARCHKPPKGCELAWEKLIVNGGGLPVPAGSTANNARIFQFKEFNGYLYFTAGETFRSQFGPPAELGRIGPDGRWDLIVGAARDANTMAAYPNFNCQRQGDWCLPLSGRGPSFGPDPFTRGAALYFWQLLVHDGFFYLGTAENGQGGGLGTCGSPGEGFDLWQSHNGIDWSLVFDDGLGNPCNYGARKLESTPLGMFLGTANPRTIEDGTGPSGGTGGAEVYLGISSHKSHK